MSHVLHAAPLLIACAVSGVLAAKLLDRFEDWRHQRRRDAVTEVVRL